jgi:multiple sugar transport system substrate-binding protein
VNVRRKERTWRLAAAGLVTLGLLASGCGSGGGSSDGKVTIRYSWWGAQDRAELINKTVKLFEKKYPDITVKTDFAEYADFWQKFNTQSAGGNAPDVFQNSYAFLRKYTGKNVLLDLSPQVKAGNLDMSDFRAGLGKAGEIDGKLVGVPVGANTMALFYDVDTFKKAGVTPKFGWTWDDYDKAVRKISASGKVKGASGPGGVMYWYDLVLRQQNKAFFTADGKLGFTEADLKDWWSKNHQETSDGVFVSAKTVAQVTPSSTLSKGFAASEPNWDNFLLRYHDETKANVALAPVPTTDGKRTGQYLSSLMLSGYSHTQHPAEVAKFINFMVNDPQVGKIMGYNRGVLATNAQFDAFKPTGVNKEIADYETAVAKAGLLEKITPHPSGADTCEAAFLRIFSEINQGTTSVDEGVTKFFSEAKTALSS